jgi:hypothetical protein
VIFDSSGNGAATLTINTAATMASLDSSSPRRDSQQLAFLWLPVAGFALMGVGFSPRRVGRKKLTVFVLCGLLFSGLIFQAACAGESSGKSHTQTTYTITITGTSGLAQHSTTTSLTVQ